MEFNLESAYKLLYGYRGLPFPAYTESAKDLLPKNPLSIISGVLPVKTANNTLILSSLKLGEYKLPIEVLVSVGYKTHVIKRNTFYPTKTGSIKELWGIDDYKIDIKGLFFDSEQSKATDELLKFQKEIKKVVVECNSDILINFGIKRIAIESVEYPYDRGINAIPFTISAVSDSELNDFILEL